MTTAKFKYLSPSLSCLHVQSSIRAFVRAGFFRHFGGEIFCFPFTPNKSLFCLISEKPECQTLEVENDLHAGEVCPLSSDSPAAVQGTASNLQDSIEQPTSKSFVQTVFDGLYDVGTQFSLPFKKPKQAKKTPTSAPVQLTLFELLQPYAIEQYEKMRALAQAYLKDFTELKNPQSRLFKMLGSKAQKRFSELESKLRTVRRELVAHFLCWELPERLWMVV